MENEITLPQMLPDDLNAEWLLDYYPQGTCKISFSGLHKRNTYNDIVDMELMANKTLHLTLSRNSIYNSLPEYMFHPIDRFDNLPKSEEKELFERELEKQDEEITNAYKFFSPTDILLFHLRANVRESIEKYAKEDIIMQHILGDSMTEKQRNNRFIQAVIHYLPQCRIIRGNKTLLALMLRKIFGDEGIKIGRRTELHSYEDPHPRYADSMDMELNDGYVGGEYTEPVQTYRIIYWDNKECEKDLSHFLNEIEELRAFIQDYFLSIEEELVFEIVKDDEPMQLGEESASHFLNYNINI